MLFSHAFRLHLHYGIRRAHTASHLHVLVHFRPPHSHHVSLSCSYCVQCRVLLFPFSASHVACSFLTMFARRVDSQGPPNPWKSQPSSPRCVSSVSNVVPWWIPILSSMREIAVRLCRNNCVFISAQYPGSDHPNNSIIHPSPSISPRPIASFRVSRLSHLPWRQSSKK